ncbi:DUF2537 domain-containing protein [Umezawaea beigongshangensis]|uniref:DUF2537 domain-containing protein n=1 Tax=Umezawaea beigongshangensis TaxID=2780383 RepID=UPI0018F1AEB8|nr:DUF2537 domain-containing protein [Umezawaea beigongshangensis]
MELRVRDGRAVLAGRDETGEQEVDPHTLPLGGGLAEALHEWAKVADAVTRNGVPDDGAAAALVTRRGRQLALRLAASMRTPVTYSDPVTGETGLITAPEPPAPTPEGPAEEPSPSTPAKETPGEETPAEETPWATGLTVSGVVTALVAFSVVTLSLGLGETGGWLALVANVLVVGGLAPSVWLARRVPVWRWVAHGVVAGVLLAWFALVLTLL